MRQGRKVRVQRVLDEILSGAFNENDIDLLFIYLREYCNGYPRFREVANFVAHPELRNRGDTHQLIGNLCFTQMYHTAYGLTGKPVEIRKPFPKWVKDHMKRQVDKCKPNELWQKFNIKPKELKTRINTLFKEDDQKETVNLSESIDRETFEAIYHILRFANYNPLFTADDLMKELVGVLHKNHFSFDEKALIDRGATIILCVMLLMHHSEFMVFEVNDSQPFKCAIMAAPPLQTDQPAAGEAGEGLIAWGHETLRVCAPMRFESGTGPITTFFPIFTSDLRVNDNCDEKLLAVAKPLAPDSGSCLYFDQDLGLTHNLKLGLV
jgi:hypothetical protein